MTSTKNPTFFTFNPLLENRIGLVTPASIRTSLCLGSKVQKIGQIELELCVKTETDVEWTTHPQQKNCTTQKGIWAIPWRPAAQLNNGPTRYVRMSRLISRPTLLLVLPTIRIR